jgi:hypothetical protein
VFLHAIHEFVQVFEVVDDISTNHVIERHVIALSQHTPHNDVNIVRCIAEEEVVFSEHTGKCFDIRFGYPMDFSASVLADSCTIETGFDL